MARYRLFIHHAVDNWVSEHRPLQRRADWLLAELAARGLAGRPKGVAGPAREVLDLPGQRWRRSGLGGFDYYAWWFEAGDSAPFPPESRVVRAIRQHDIMTRLATGDASEYSERSFDDLHPLTDEQAAVVRAAARVRLAVGHPGTGKTGALLYAVREEAARSPTARLLYVTLSRGLAEDARQFLEGLPELAERIEVSSYEDLLASWGQPNSRQAAIEAATDASEEAAFLGFLGDQPRNELNPWQRARESLWAEVRAHLIGRALPYEFSSRQQPACDQPFLARETYRNLRDRELGALATNTAWKLAERFISSQPCASLHRQAWDVLRRIGAGQLDGRLASLDGLIVDEIQDLTLLQLAVLVETARRLTELNASPCFIAAGDESQIVHPSGFDWGVCKDLLRERLGVDPEEFQLTTNQRSPAPLVEASNRTARLYDELPKSYRPQAKVEADKTEAANGRVSLCRVDSDEPDLTRWLEALAETAGSALVVCPGVAPTGLGQAMTDARFADLIYEPAVVKGLDRQYVVVCEASQTLRQLRHEVEAARSRGDDRPRYLAARCAIDQLRVAISRSNETLVFLDSGAVERDPLLQDLVADGVADEATPGHLADVLQLRADDPLERTLELFRESADLLDVDLPRAMRSLQRADGALANLRDSDYRRQALRQRIEVRRRTASRLLASPSQVATGKRPDQGVPAHFEAVAEQFAEVERSFRELAQSARAEQYALLARRYREAPPGSGSVGDRLPGLLDQYVAALSELPKREQRAALFTLPREWRAELAQAEWRVPGPLRHCLAASERLAELTNIQQDRRAAGELRAQLAELLLGLANWAEALETLSALPSPPPTQLARCYEGLKVWDQAASLREQGGDLDRALDDYRRAGDPLRAGRLAARLGQPQLAAALRAAADLAARLEAVEQIHAEQLTEAERKNLADGLRRTAGHLTSRQQRPKQSTA